MSETWPTYKFVTYETIDDGTIARIMLNRPDARNAQNRGLLVELDHAFLRAEADDTVRVVILGGTGPLFSAGHDMGSKDMVDEQGDSLQLPRPTAARATAPRSSSCRSGTTTSRTRCVGGTCARSRSGRRTATCTPRV